MDSRDIQQAISAIGAAGSGMARTTRDVGKTMEAFIKQQEAANKELEKELGKTKKWHTARDKAIADNLKSMIMEQKERLKALKSDRATYAKLREEREKELRKKADLERKIQEIDNGTTKASKEKREKYKEELEAVDERIDGIKDEQRRSIRMYRDNANNIRDLSKMVKQSEDELGRAFPRLREVLEETFSTVGNELKSKFNFDRIKSLAKDAFEFSRTMKSTGSDFAYTSLKTQGYLIAAGLSVEDYTQMVKENRAVMLRESQSRGDYIVRLQKEAFSMSQHFRTLGDATKYVHAQTSILAKAGISDALRSTSQLTDSMTHLQKMAGMTGDEFNSMLESYSEDTDMRANLRQMDSRQRMEMMKGLVLRAKENAALGISTEQSLAMAKNMAQLDKETYKERHNRAARLQSLTGAIGMSGGNELAAIMRKSVSVRTADEQAQLEKGLTEVANRVADMRGTGSAGQEMMIDALTANLGLESMIGKDSTFNTNQAEALKIAETSAGALEHISDVTSEVPTLIRAMQMGMDWYHTTSTSLLGVIAGTAVLGGVGMVGKKMATKRFGGGKGPKGGLGKAIGGAADAAKNAVVGGAGKAGGLAKAVAPAMDALSNASDIKKAATVAEAASKSAMKSVMKKIPVLGAFAGLFAAGSRLMDGDFVGASMEAASGLASTVPGLGTAASLGLDAALYARDAGMTPSILSSGSGDVESAKKAQKDNGLKEMIISTDETNEILGKMVSRTDSSNGTLIKMMQQSEYTNELLQEMIEVMQMTEEERRELQQKNQVMFGGRNNPSYSAVR